jgi:hypothetical protein
MCLWPGLVVDTRYMSTFSGITDAEEPSAEELSSARTIATKNNISENLQKLTIVTKPSNLEFCNTGDLENPNIFFPGPQYLKYYQSLSGVELCEVFY